jgi:hypothetical protein
MVLGTMSFLHNELGDFEAAEREAKRGIAICREIGAPQFRSANEVALAHLYLRAGRDAESLRYVLMATATLREVEDTFPYQGFLYGMLKIRRGDRRTGLRWIGHARAHEKEFEKELKRDLQRFGDEIQGDWTPEEVEAAMREGESMSSDEIEADAKTMSF